MGKRFTLPALAAVTIGAIILVLVMATRRQSRDDAAIIDTRRPITQEDYWNTLGPVDRFNGSAAAAFFEETAANKHTLDFFGFLQDRFRNMEYGDHMRAVRDYLHDTIRPPERAEEVYRLYGKYNDYQKELYLDQRYRAAGGTPEQMLKSLRDLQDFRRQRFGEDTADSIFGVEVKSNEYALRKQIVIGDASLSGSEKEERLASLRREMWGDQAETVDSRQSPLDRYNEKLQIHRADLAAMDEEERARKISGFRREIFTSEEAGRMDNADRQLDAIRKRDSEYARQSRAILDDPALSEEEKNRRIRELHTRIYGGSGSAPSTGGR